jgi:maltooligosyltrehalose trehalohydrolase
VASTGSTDAREPFAVWAPTPSRLRLSVGDAIVEMSRSGGDWWVPDGEIPDPTQGPLDYGYLIDDSDVARPAPPSRGHPAGPAVSCRAR